MTRMEAVAEGYSNAGIPLPLTFRPQTGESSGIYFMFDSPADGIYAAIARAARLLRLRPGVGLLPGRRLPDDLQNQLGNDVPTKTLLNLLNLAIVPSPSYFHTLPSRFSSGPVKALGACAKAEVAFAEVFAQMQTPAHLLPSKPELLGYELVTNRAKRVIAVGKGSHGEPSALSLEDLYINGHLYPAGTLLRADPGQGRDRDDKSDRPTERIQTPATAIVDIAALRLTAFALDPSARRNDFASPLAQATPATREVLYDMTTHDLQALAQSALTGLS
jgi:hypothetical protein